MHLFILVTIIIITFAHFQGVQQSQDDLFQDSQNDSQNQVSPVPIVNNNLKDVHYLQYVHAYLHMVLDGLDFVCF